jgi:hypothetical protein
MQARLALSALLIAGLASIAAAQQIQTPQQAAPPAPAKPPKPAASKPKPAAEKKLAPSAGVKARLVDKIGDWSVFISEDAYGRVCFAAAEPADKQPKEAKRTLVVFYVTTWPKDGVRNQVSVRLGYAIKGSSAASVTAGGKRFALAGDDGDKYAYPKDLADEPKLLAAMAAGGPMVVKATSAKGTATTDQYSLDGASAAVQKLQQACP